MLIFVNDLISRWLAGVALGNHIIGARANLAEYDARYGEEDGENWLMTANSFLVSIQMLNVVACEGELTPKTNRLFVLVNKCKELLDQPWNSELPQCPKLKKNLRKIAMGSDANNNSDTSEPPGKKMRTNKKRARAKKGKSTFIQLTPPKPVADNDKIMCQKDTCQVLFSSQAALKAHFKIHHPEDEYIQPEKIVNPASGRTGSGMKRVDKVSKEILSYVASTFLTR